MSRRAGARARLRHASPVILACSAIVLGACGEDGGAPGPVAAAPPEPQTVTADERRLLEAYDRRIAAHCLRVNRSVVDPGAAPTERQVASAFEAARKLLALAADKPEAPLGAGQDVRLFVSDVIENLEGSNCDPRMIGVLEAGLQKIDQP